MASIPSALSNVIASMQKGKQPDKRIEARHVVPIHDDPKQSKKDAKKGNTPLSPFMPMSLGGGMTQTPSLDPTSNQKQIGTSHVLQALAGPVANNPQVVTSLNPQMVTPQALPVNGGQGDSQTSAPPAQDDSQSMHPLQKMGIPQRGDLGPIVDLTQPDKNMPPEDMGEFHRKKAADAFQRGLHLLDQRDQVMEPGPPEHAKTGLGLMIASVIASALDPQHQAGGALYAAGKGAMQNQINDRYAKAKQISDNLRAHYGAQAQSAQAEAQMEGLFGQQADTNKLAQARIQAGTQKDVLDRASREKIADAGNTTKGIIAGDRGAQAAVNAIGPAITAAGKNDGTPEGKMAAIAPLSMTIRRAILKAKQAGEPASIWGLQSWDQADDNWVNKTTLDLTAHLAGPQHAANMQAEHEIKQQKFEEDYRQEVAKNKEWADLAPARKSRMEDEAKMLHLKLGLEPQQAAYTAAHLSFLTKQDADAVVQQQMQKDLVESPWGQQLPREQLAKIAKLQISALDKNVAAFNKSKANAELIDPTAGDEYQAEIDQAMKDRVYWLKIMAGGKHTVRKDEKAGPPSGNNMNGPFGATGKTPLGFPTK